MMMINNNNMFKIFKIYKYFQIINRILVSIQKDNKGH